MKLKQIMTAALLLIGLATAMDVKAQEADYIQWKGNDYQTLLNAGETEVFLYNVGTGRFLVHGGDWGIQARLFSEDNGKTLTLKYGAQGTNIIFNTGMTTVHNGQYCNNLGCNIPRITSSDNWGNGDATFTVLMDAKERIADGTANGTYRNWQFQRVTGTADDVFTYYLYETISDTNYYMGAVYGKNSNSHDGDPNGELAMLSSSYDKVTWTTAVPETDTKYTCGLKSVETSYIEGSSVDRSMNDEVRIYGGVDVELNKLYQWRIVTKQQLIDLISSTDADESGTNINLTYLIEDRGFERNDYAFFDDPEGWVAKPFTDNIYTTSGEGQYYYTWGYYRNAGTKEAPSPQVWNAQSPRYTSDYNYNYPVRLKSQYDSKTNAKFGFIEFEGTGTASTYITVPDGTPDNSTFSISGYGFYQGANQGYFFATTTDPSELSISDFQDPAKVTTFELKERTGLSKNTSANVMAAGDIFAPAQSDYQAEVTIKANPGDKIYFGVAKLGATKSSSDASEGGTTTTYYYITYTSGRTTYYLTSDLVFSSDESQAVLWTYSNNRFSTTVDGSTRYLTYTGSTTSASLQLTTSTSNAVSYRNNMVYGPTQSGMFSTTYYYLQGNTTGATPSFANSSSNAASRTEKTITTGGTNYYHDTDWVGADQFSIAYLGTDPVMFDEDETSLDYLKEEGGADKQYTNQSIRIHRTMVKDQWNSFVFPLNLSATQVRAAFGDNCQLAEITELGEFSKLPTCIDFAIKTLPNEGEGIKAGKFYLVKPAVEPRTSSSGIKYYECGRASFNTSDFGTITKETVYVSDAAKDYANQHDMPTDWLNNVVTTYGTYVADQRIPSGSYVMGYKKTDDGHNVQLFRITSETNIQGFRGWIEDGVGTTQGARTLVVGGIYDTRTYVDHETGVEHIQLQTRPADDDIMYDLSGRRIGKVAEFGTLPRGLYIVNGKKVFIK